MIWPLSIFFPERDKLIDSAIGGFTRSISRLQAGMVQCMQRRNQIAEQVDALLTEESGLARSEHRASHVVKSLQAILEPPPEEDKWKVPELTLPWRESNPAPGPDGSKGEDPESPESGTSG